VQDVLIDRGTALTAYVAAWSAGTATEVREALDACWTEDSTYVSPLTDVVRGVDGLTDLILDLPVMFPDAALTSTREPDLHHDVACVPWRLRSTARIRLLGQDHGHALDGIDVAEFDEAGHIRRVTAFFGFGTPQAG
jgi:hypothetical protein